jgi:uncharacterized membrane protein YoaT (DUF817 family)
MKRIINAFLVTLILGISSLVLVTNLWIYPKILTLGLIIISFLMLLTYKKEDEIILFFLCGVAGAIAEITAIYFGAWKYSLTNFANIPYWLPILWGIAAVYIKRISERIKDYINSKVPINS